MEMSRLLGTLLTTCCVTCCVSYVMGLFIQKQHFPLCKPQRNHHCTAGIALLSKEQCTLQPNL